ELLGLVFIHLPELRVTVDGVIINLHLGVGCNNFPIRDHKGVYLGKAGVILPEEAVEFPYNTPDPGYQFTFKAHLPCYLPGLVWQEFIKGVYMVPHYLLRRLLCQFLYINAALNACNYKGHLLCPVKDNANIEFPVYWYLLLNEHPFNGFPFNL